MKIIFSLQSIYINKWWAIFVPWLWFADLDSSHHIIQGSSNCQIQWLQLSRLMIHTFFCSLPMILKAALTSSFPSALASAQSFPSPIYLPFPPLYKHHYAEFCVICFFPCFAIVYSIHEKLCSCIFYENSNVLLLFSEM